MVCQFSAQSAAADAEPRSGSTLITVALRHHRAQQRALGLMHDHAVHIGGSLTFEQCEIACQFLLNTLLDRGCGVLGANDGSPMCRA